MHEDELEVINNLRSLYNEAVELGQNPADVKHGWVKSKESSLFIKNPNFENQLDKQKEFKEKLLKSLKGHSLNTQR